MRKLFDGWFNLVSTLKNSAPKVKLPCNFLGKQRNIL